MYINKIIKTFSFLGGDGNGGCGYHAWIVFRMDPIRIRLKEAKRKFDKQILE